MNFSMLLLLISAIWVSSELFLASLVRSKGNSANKDQGSIVWLNLTIYFCVGIAIALNILGLGNIYELGMTVRWIGLCIIVLGIIIRWTAILTLRKYFTTNVAIREDHRLIQSGMYKFIRHPSYSGSIISFLGLGLVFANWLALIILIIPITFMFKQRIRIEERALEEAFGEEYRNYHASTWQLFPWIF